MGGSQSGASPFGGCAPGAAPRQPGGPLVMSVVRTSAWGMGTEDDVWQVEVPGAATVADLKAKIEELYEVPQQMQKLTRSAEASEQGLEDIMKVETLERQRVYLLPALNSGEPFGQLFGESSPEAQAEMAGMVEMLLGGAQESMEMDQALLESLQGVTYKVHFERPAAAGGRAAGKKISLDLDALALVGDVQQMVEVELFGSTEAESAFLMFEGALLPPHIPLHIAGIEDGKTVTVSAERPPPSESELLMAGLLGGGMGAGIGGPGGMMPQELLASLLAGGAAGAGLGTRVPPARG